MLVTHTTAPERDLLPDFVQVLGGGAQVRVKRVDDSDLRARLLQTATNQISAEKTGSANDKNLHPPASTVRSIPSASKQRARQPVSPLKRFVSATKLRASIGD